MLINPERPGASIPRSAHMHPGPGFRIQRLPAPSDSDDLAAMFADFEVADISDQLNRLYALDPSIHCLSGAGRRLIGRACTVRVYPGDNLMVHKALDLAAPGQVVVVDARGSSLNAVLGDTICTKARHRGIAGYVVDGHVRDLPAIRDLDFPVFARGDTPIGPLHRGPGEINYPICCGGVVVNPGDVIVADAGGLVVIPNSHVAETHARLVAAAAESEGYKKRVQAGSFSNAWVDDTLRSGGCDPDL